MTPGTMAPDQTEMNLRPKDPQEEYRRKLEAAGIRPATAPGIGRKIRAAKLRPAWLAFFFRVARRAGLKH